MPQPVANHRAIIPPRRRSAIVQKITASHTRSRCTLALVAMLTAWCLHSASATTRTSITSGRWNDTTTWQGRVVPATGDSVLIATGTTVTLDTNTALLQSLHIDGTLNGATDTIFITEAFTAAGSWNPNQSTVVFASDSAQTIDSTSVTSFYNLILASPTYATAQRIIQPNLNVAHDLLASFSSDTESISGPSIITVAHNVAYRGGSPARWTGALTFISPDSTTRGDTSFFTAHLIQPSTTDTFLFPQIIIAKNDSSIVRLGSARFAIDTFFTSRNADTIVTIRSGAFDLQSGWIRCTTPVATNRPIIDVRPGTSLRLSAPLPIYDGATPSPIYDSASTPIFQLDSGCNVSYYSPTNDVIDASYLINNIPNHAYQNLTLGENVIASAWANPITILSTFHILRGSTFKPSYQKSGAPGSGAPSITLYGDVLNDAPGPDGAPGYYSGTLSDGTDTWIFTSHDTATHSDTIRWIGPSQLGNVTIEPNTVLSVRFLSDTVCDSLNMLGHLTEADAPCGGHLIGRVISELPITFGLSHPIDSLHNLGFTITSGSAPYLADVRVTRTSGYPPPGSNPNAHPLLRYYQTYTTSPAQAIPNHIEATFHCDEMNNATISQLGLWRAMDLSGNWVYLGTPTFNPTTNTFAWDVSELHPTGTNRSYYWMLEEGYRDTPTPVELLSFNATPSTSGVNVQWQTASEIDAIGFLITRRPVPITDSAKPIADWTTNPKLRSKNRFGANYNFLDTTAPSGQLEYNLIEQSVDGLKSTIATITVNNAPVTSTEPTLSFDGTSLHIQSITNPATLRIYDILGREIESHQILTNGAYAIHIHPGRYWAALTDGEHTVTLPILLQ